VSSFFVIAVGVFGLLIGSFLNVVAYRIPLRRSVVSPPSSCPHCDAEIAWYDNIPVISWLILRGKCRRCSGPISRRYPAVELGTGLLFAGVAFSFIPRLVFDVNVATVVASVVVLVAYLYLAAVSVALALIDLDTHTLPNRIVYPTYFVGVVLFTVAALLTGDYGSLLTAGIAMAVMFAAYFVMVLAYPGGMGFGDVKLAGSLGIFLGWLGWGEVAVGAFAPFVLGGVFAIVLIIARGAGRKTRIPFGPWMLLGAWVGIFVGSDIASWYLGLFGLN